MKCKLSFVALLAVLSAANAVSVDYYHDHHAHPAHVKYIEPAHVKPFKYFQPSSFAPVTPVAPVYKHIPSAPVKYIHQESQPVKYIHQEPQPVKYVHQEPQSVKYIHSDPHYAKHVEYDEPANYEFGYDVHDTLTGDVKSHSEKRDGNTVSGRYEVLDPDGFKRIVEYTADDHNGFNAVVTREPTDIKVIKKVYEPFVKAVAPVPVAPVQKFIVPHHESIVTATPRYFGSPIHQKIVAPIVKHYTAPQYSAPQYPAPQYSSPHYSSPQYYAPPEHPKFFKPAFEKVAKVVKPAYEYEPHTAVKYVTANDYNRY